jgi:glycine oxidase
VQDTVWTRTLSKADQEALSASDGLPGRAEIVIIGAGLIGLATAYHLIEAGYRKICIVDRAGPIGEASGANAGGLWFAQQSPDLGPIAGLSQLSNRLYDGIGERFACSLARRGVLELLYGEDEQSKAEERAEAMRTAGFRAQAIAPDHIRELEPELAVRAGALYSLDDGQLHPAKLAAAWVRYLRGNGVRICRGIEATRLDRPLRTSAGNVHADRVVIAAGAWTPLLTAALGWRPPIRPVRGALLALPDGPRRIHHTVMAGRYYYWQLEDGPIAGGGSEERVGFERGVRSEIIQDIRAEMGQHFPGLVNQPTEVAWYGFRPYCEDNRPVVGAIPGRDDLFVGAGHFRKGVMLAPGTGKVLAQLATGQEPEVDLSALDPARFAIAPV